MKSTGIIVNRFFHDAIVFMCSMLKCKGNNYAGAGGYLCVFLLHNCTDHYCIGPMDKMVDCEKYGNRGKL